MSNQRLRDRYDLPFTILADADQKVITRWGIYNFHDPKKRPIPHPATYIVDLEGMIRWHAIGLKARDRPSPGLIIAKLTEIG